MMGTLFVKRLMLEAKFGKDPLFEVFSFPGLVFQLFRVIIK